jgi:Zn-dependent protease
MESHVTTEDARVIPVAPPPKRRPLARLFSGFLLTAGVLALKAKALAFVVFDYLRNFAVNPFEGFGAVQYGVAGGSMLLSIIAYYPKTPWKGPFAIGFVVITAIHEAGHAIVIRRKGLRAGLMVFIPFVGGAVTLKDQPRTVYDDAMIGLAGPVAGTMASLVSLQIYKWTDETLWLAIAGGGFLLNLVNLLPIGMLDGGRISAAITKWMWVIGGGLLVYKVVKEPNLLLVLVVLLVAFQVYASIVREHEDVHFYDITLSERAFVAAAYFALVIFLGHQTYVTLNRLQILLKQL